jgi:hypothetical protein
MSDMSFSQQQQVVDSQYNAGRDQNIIQNFIVLGQFLDFADIQGLIPKQTTSSDFTSIVDAFEKTFSERLETDLVDGISFVGDTLKKTVLEILPDKQNALPSATNSAILEKIFRAVVEKVYEMNYRIHFSERVEMTKESNYMVNTYIILWLESLQLLWAKHFQQDEKKCKFGIRLENPEYRHQVSMIRITKPKIFTDVNFSSLSVEQTRVMMVGLVIDLLRFYTMGASHLKFWQGLVGLITKDYKKEQPDSSNSENRAYR